MAIRLIQGKIGSGKTYYAVQHVINNYYTWDDQTDSWIPKNRDVEIRIFTNIKNMKLGYDLEYYMKEAGGLTSFFNNKYQESFCKGVNTIYIIDEAQSGAFFHRKFYDVGVFLFFQMHRHLGVDIYLITQDIRCLARELQELAEYNIRAVRRSHTVGSYFVYKFYTGNDYKDECFKTKRIKKDQKIFGLYRSMVAKETEKVRSVTYKHMLIFLLLIIGAGVVFKYGFMTALFSSGKVRKSVKQAELNNPEVVQLQSKQVIRKSVYKIIGIAGDHYLVNVENRLVRVKIDKENPKQINDELTIEGN